LEKIESSAEVEEKEKEIKGLKRELEEKGMLIEELKAKKEKLEKELEEKERTIEELNGLIRDVMKWLKLLNIQAKVLSGEANKLKK